MPALGHPAARQLDRALIEGRLELQQEQGGFDVEDARHDPMNVSGGSARLLGPAGRCVARPQLTATNLCQFGRAARAALIVAAWPPRRHARRARPAPLVVVGGLAAVLAAGLGLVLFVAADRARRRRRGASCRGRLDRRALDRAGPPGSGRRVGATEYGGPGDPTAASVGASGANLLAHPDSYAELGGMTVPDRHRDGRPALHDAAADHLGRALGDRLQARLRPRRRPGGRAAAGDRPVVAVRRGARDPVRATGCGRARSGSARPPAAGRRQPCCGQSAPGGGRRQRVAGARRACATALCGSGPGRRGAGDARAAGQLLPDGTAAAPGGAPAAVKGIIAAGNQIVGKPYLYGGGHGTAARPGRPAYDCSSSVEHLLYGGGLLPVDYDAASGDA